MTANFQLEPAPSLGPQTDNRIDLCSSEAQIVIGKDCFVNGDWLAARKRLEIGARGILGDCRIMDSDFHSTAINRHQVGVTTVDKPVVLSENVWVGNAAIILKGVHIGAQLGRGGGSSGKPIDSQQCRIRRQPGHPG